MGGLFSCLWSTSQRCYCTEEYFPLRFWCGYSKGRIQKSPFCWTAHSTKSLQVMWRRVTRSNWWFEFQKAGKWLGTSWSCPVFRTLLVSAVLFCFWTLFGLTLRELTSQVLKKEQAVTLKQIGVNSHDVIRGRRSCQNQELLKETKG